MIQVDTRKAHGNVLCVANWDSNVGYAWWLMESFWAEIANKAPQGRKVYMAFPTISKIPEEISDSPLEVKEINFSTNFPEDTQQQLAFIRQHGIKIIYFSDAKNFRFKYLLYRIAGVRKIVNHDHSPGTIKYVKPWKRAIKHLLQRFRWFSADLTICTTEYVRQRAIQTKCIPDSQLSVAANGIRISQPQTTRTQPRTLISIGRLSPVKNIDFALRVVARLVAEYGYDDVKYYVCGDGPELAKLKSLASELGVAENVEFTGKVDSPAKLFSFASVGFHPSKAEVGYSLAILEVMVEGIPMVVPNNPSVCEPIEHNVNGFIYAESDIESAADAIHQLFADEEKRSSLGRQARDTVVKSYQLSGTHQALIKAFEEKVYE